MTSNNIIEDVHRYRNIGEDTRDDLKEFITEREMGYSDEKTVRIPFTVVDLPEFEYDMRDTMEMEVGEGDGDEDEDGEEKEAEKEEGDEAGDESRENLEFHEMDLEEFAERMEEILDLDLEPKGKEATQTKEGEFKDRSKTGPRSTLRKDILIKQGLKRQTAMEFDKEYCREILKVDGIGPKKAFDILRKDNHQVSFDFLERAYDDINKSEKSTYKDIDEFKEENEPKKKREILRKGNYSDYFRKEDEEHIYPDMVPEDENNVVIVNIRDASASMGRANRRELLQRVFAPIDWTLAGKYDKAEFVYIVHSKEADRVDREKFFTIKSGSGTRVSSGYELAKEILDEEYPEDMWNRYVIAGGDGENSKKDSKEKVAPLVESIEANLHAYVQVSPNNKRGSRDHKSIMEKELDMDNFISVEVNGKDDIWDSIKKIFQKEVDTQ